MARPRRFRWGFAVLGVVLLALILWLVFGHKKAAAPPKTPTVAVSAVKATVQDLPISITELGSALPWQGVLVRTQVNGKLLKVAFREGGVVKAGDLLAEVDAAPYQAVLLQAQGALKRDMALLDAARVDLKRFQTLKAQDSIATQQVDTQAALVKQDEGLVLIDKGAVAAAQVNVNYCRITSPVTGRAGVRMVDPGNIVSTSDTTGIVIVNQITPIAVTFTVPQGDFQRLSNVSNGFTRPLATRALSQETGADLGAGELSIADNRVEPATGTVEMKARFENAAQHLWPGQFVNVKLTLQTLQHAVSIPASAVNQGPKGAFVYLVGPDRKAVMRPVTVAVTQDAVAAIQAGVQAGDMVITDGQLSLKPGSLVSVHPPVAAKAAP